MTLSKRLILQQGILLKFGSVLEHIITSSNFKNANIKYDITMPSMIPRREIDISLAHKLLNWRPKVSISDGIERTVDWYHKVLDKKR